MAHMIQFDDSQQGRPPLCIACEEMLTDAIDQTLSPADQAWFDRHIASCADCSVSFADAQRGAAWLELLKSPRPEPSAALMERILAQTSEMQHDTFLNPAIVGQPVMLPVPAAPRGNLLGFRPRLPQMASWMNPNSQPRLYMTAAMAFFSIALTLNLAGVRLDQIKASNLSPTNVRKTYYEASADAVRYYDNLRVVRVMESRVDGLLDSSDDRRTPDRNQQTRPASSEPKVPESQQDQKPAAKDPNGPSSRIEAPVSRPRFMTTSALTIPSLSAPTARLIPAQGETLGYANPTNQRAKGPTYLGRLITSDRPTQISKHTQEGGLA